MHDHLTEYDRDSRNLWLDGLPQLAAAIEAAGLSGPLSVSSSLGFDRAEKVLAARYGSFEQGEFAEDAKRLTQLLGRPETSVSDGALDARWTVGTRASIEYTLWSTSCTQVVVGTERKVVTEEVEPAQFREVEKDVDIVEWRCPEGLFDDLLLTKGNL